MMSSKPVGMAAACVTAFALLGPAPALAADKDERPKLVVTARPSVAIAPARVLLTAELVGGANDYEAFYCPTVIWEWGDGTVSESSTDCQPYEPGVSEIQRRFRTEHRFRAGTYRVVFMLKNRDKEVAASTVQITVRAGGRPD